MWPVSGASAWSHHNVCTRTTSSISWYFSLHVGLYITEKRIMKGTYYRPDMKRKKGNGSWPCPVLKDYVAARRSWTLRAEPQIFGQAFPFFSFHLVWPGESFCLCARPENEKKKKEKEWWNRWITIQTLRVRFHHSQSLSSLCFTLASKGFLKELAGQ